MQRLNKKLIQSQQGKQAGQVSILTVVIFMLLFSIIVVSFTRIMTAASHETVSDELRAQATAAAESGIEDAKRILSYCSAYPTASGCGTDGIQSTSQDCNTIMGNTSLMNAIGINSSTGLSNFDGTPQVVLAMGSSTTCV